MSALWYGDNGQLDIIKATKEPLERELGQPIATPVRPLETFYYAEDYHQKYALQRHHDLMKAFSAMYPEFKGFVDSTAAARLNGFAARHGAPALFDEESDDYGFTVDDLKSLRPR